MKRTVKALVLVLVLAAAMALLSGCGTEEKEQPSGMLSVTIKGQRYQLTYSGVRFDHWIGEYMALFDLLNAEGQSELQMGIAIDQAVMAGTYSTAYPYAGVKLFARTEGETFYACPYKEGYPTRAENPKTHFRVAEEGMGSFTLRMKTAFGSSMKTYSGSFQAIFQCADDYVNTNIDVQSAEFSFTVPYDAWDEWNERHADR